MNSSMEWKKTSIETFLRTKGFFIVDKGSLDVLHSKKKLLDLEQFTEKFLWNPK